MVDASAMLSEFVTHKFLKFSNSVSESDDKYNENPRRVIFISF